MKTTLTKLFMEAELLKIIHANPGMCELELKYYLEESLERPLQDWEFEDLISCIFWKRVLPN